MNDNNNHSRPEKNIRINGRAFGFYTAVAVGIIIGVFNMFYEKDNSAVLSILMAAVAGSLGYEAYVSKNKSTILLSILFAVFTLYSLFQYISMNL